MTASSVSPLETVLSQLQRVKSTGREKWQACCPGHADQKQSLSIGLGDNGGVLLKCFAGCDLSTILSALGLSPADLFPPRDARPSGPRRIVATYDYTNEHGKMLYQVVRYDPKDFRQRRPLVPNPTRSEDWKWSLTGVQRVLYRLPDVLSAVSAGEILFLPEGEKDCENLRALGLNATTNAQGADQPFLATYADVLRGARVVILPDNDVAGRKCRDRRGKALQGKAADVRVLDLPGLPDKGDVSDWLQAGGTKEELLRLAEGAPLWTPPAAVDTDDEDAPADALLRVRKDVFGKQISRYAKLKPHGGMEFIENIDLQELAFIGKAGVRFYGKLTDAQRFDLAAVWMQALPLCEDQGREKKSVAAQLFGYKGPQVRNWASQLRHIEPARWRPHLPMWVHESVRGLSEDDQELVFDIYEGDRSLTQEEVLKMVQGMKDTDMPEHTRQRSASPQTATPPLADWKLLAQTLEGIEGGSAVVTHLLRLIQAQGPCAVIEQLLAIPLETETDSWAGRDVIEPDLFTPQDAAQETEKAAQEGVSNLKLVAEGFRILKPQSTEKDESGFRILKPDSAETGLTTPEETPAAPPLIPIRNKETTYRDTKDKPPLPASDFVSPPLPPLQTLPDVKTALRPFQPLWMAAKARAFACEYILVDPVAEVSTEDLNIFVIRQVNACRNAAETGDTARAQEALRLLGLCEAVWKARRE